MCAADDPARGHLPGDFDFLPPEADREDVMDPSRMQDPDKQMVRRAHFICPTKLLSKNGSLN